MIQHDLVRGVVHDDVGVLPRDFERDRLRQGRDGVLDGQEVHGYKVTIAWYEGDDLRSQDLVVKGKAFVTVQVVR